MSVWQAPLVPIALAATAGIVLDRYQTLPVAVSLTVALVALVAWAMTRLGNQRGLDVVYLGLCCLALGAAYHHAHRNLYHPNDIGYFASAEPVPAQIRGVLEEEPAIVWQPPHNPLRSMDAVDSTRAVLQVTSLKQEEEWLPVSGRAQLMVGGRLRDLHVGDEVEVVGRLVAPQGPANPGEFDYAGFLQDQRIRAELLVSKTADGVSRLARGWPSSFTGWLMAIRAWGQRTLQDILPPEQSRVGVALLLGEGSTMTNEDWDRYIRSGVIHVLAISGQHLVVLAAVLWWSLRLLGVRRSRGACFVALFLLAYALMTGGRPPVMRSAVMVCVYCGGLLLRRQTMLANSFALAWLMVAALNPTDLFNAGCQLSFLSVAVLYWGTSRWFATRPDPLEQLVEESRPLWQRLLRRGLRFVLISYAVTLAIWLALAPLVAARYHLISLAGILIGPPLVLLTSIALVTGFLTLLAAAVCSPLAPLFAWPSRWCLAGCDALVNASLHLPGSHTYLGDIPDWWLWIFYPLLLFALTMRAAPGRGRWLALGGAGWLGVGLLLGAARLPADELRCTFLAVGHGGCTVIETPDGRTLLYDAGSLAGPDVTRRQIAPFLWRRGIRRIDEIFLSHADLDHFNGLPALMDRFAIGQISCTPTFADKTSPGVRVTLAAIEGRKVPVRIVRAGDRLAAGALDMEILHPPAAGPEGNENARSLVLLLRHAGHSLLLTGDLEGAGLARLLAMPPPERLDIFMAPHHGSRLVNRPDLAAWAQAKLVVSCEGPPRGRIRPAEPYTARGALFLGTWPHGAITIRSNATGLVAETFQSGQCLVIERGSARR
jgi:competence protein ComEC